MKGSAWWRDEVPDKLGDAYTLAVIEEIKGGQTVIEFAMCRLGDLEFEIMRAPLAVGTFDDHVFVLGLSAEAVDMIADSLAEWRGLEVMSPTPALWDAAATDPRQVQIGPHTLPSLLGVPNGAAGMTKRAAKAHADAIAKSRPESCSFISGACKTYVLHPNPRPGYACEYGWRLPGKVGWGSKAATGSGHVVQPAAYAHSYRHFWDYSMGCVFVKTAARLRGKSVDLRDLARGGPDRALVAPFGAVPYIRHPDMRPALKTALSGPNTDPSPVSADGRPVIRRGDKGEDVAVWQRILMRAGYSLAPWNDDGDFGTKTHNATVGFQSERGLAMTGVVDARTWQAKDDPPTKRDEPDGGITATVLARNFTPANRKTVDQVVIHTIEIAEASTSADRCAAWFASKQAPRASAHYCLDDDSTILCVPEEHVAWAAPGLNRTGIQLEHAGYARQTAEEWFDPFSRRMLARSAKLTAAICKRWNIPPVFVDAAGLLAGKRGITTHYQVTKGPGKGRTTHVDPGRGFPMSTYLDMVKEAMG